MSNIVYLLTNPTMPDLVKIGMTDDLKSRMRSLYNSSTPVPFECYFACTVSDMKFVEKQIHDGFDDFRVNPNREFFRVDPERVVSILKMVMIEDVTPREDTVDDEIDLKALDKEKSMRSKFNFEMVQISPNSKLTFVRDPTITSRVLDKHKIEFEGKTNSLSASALEILHRLGYNWSSCAGPQLWMYEGETLSARRSRMEEE
ncbi:MAG: GIY-YIG nuclease family protein [Nitrospina sp.]|jgi:hypothetical protein|nr:GIY-YIG nuclease family protein [Nitrospina sp.]MBT3924162.1 GIY-YIG nuclease family protein [Nitrospina sp.]